ncbi:microtubule-associated protein futsch isoform X4 [Octopus sinensis]|uniref:Microtubule-associated protein futsch isoform X4 n=1 Tax=Octopus sinensis TaxID=2607531 RepID=A0A7E6F1S6_9MOLL|nr:microtubule-associated protein futsch isoform X4 [Octopus sinensis]
MEDFGTAAATKAALLLIIGEPVTEDHKHLIPEELAKGFRTWDVEAAGVDINEEVSQIANKGALGEEGPYVNSFGPPNAGERVLRYSSTTLSVEALIAPQSTTVKRSLKNFLGAPVKYHHLIYAGHVLHGSGEWILQDAPFSFSSFAATLKDPDVENALKQQEEGILNIHCFATGEWNNANLSKVGSKVLQINLNPEDKLSDLTGVLQFSTYLCNYVKCRSLKEMLRSSDVVGNIRFSKPTLYVFPGCQGDSALFGISGFNLLVNGGYNKKACFWDFTRHLDRIDALLLTHLGIDNLFGINSVLHRKSIENVHPEIGHVYFNAPKGNRNSQDESELDGKPSADSLLINLSNEGDKITDYVRQLRQVVNSCSRPATSPQIDPVNLYHKVGHGSLDMYIMNPVQDSKELKEFYQQWSKQSIQVNGSQCPLPNMLSICALLIWRPADPLEKITRIFFPGNAPQHKIIEGLEKMKTLNVLKFPKCCDKDLNAPKTAVKKSAPLKATRTTSKPLASKSEPIKREAKVEVKSRTSLSKTTNKGLKDDTNKKTSKAKEKSDKPKSSNSVSPKISPPTEVAPSAQSPLDGVPAISEPAAVVKESPPDLVQKDSNLLVDFGSTPAEAPASSPASDPLLDLIGHPSMKAESEQSMNATSPCLMNNQSPEPLPDPTHVERDATAEPEDDQLGSRLNMKQMEDMGIYDDLMGHAQRSDDAIEADKIVSSGSEDKGFDEMEEVHPESLPEPNLVLESQPIQYDDSRHGFSGNESRDITADLLPKPKTLPESEITPETAAPVEMSPERELSPPLPMDSCMSTSMYGSLMEPALPSQAEVLQNLQDDISEEKTKDDSISEDCSEIKENQLMPECEELLSEKPQDLFPSDQPSCEASSPASGRFSPEHQKHDAGLESQDYESQDAEVEGQRSGTESPSFEGQRAGTESPSFEGQRAGTESPSFEGQRAGTESPSFEGQRTGTESPSFEGQRAGTESPSFEGQRAGTESPSFEGQRDGTESPSFEGQRDGTESPSFEGQHADSKSPSYEGQRSGTESPSFEGQCTATESSTFENQRRGTETPEYQREYSDTESPEYEREHSGTESPEYERQHASAESPVYEDEHARSESPEREHASEEALGHREQHDMADSPEEQESTSDDHLSDRISPESNHEEMHRETEELDERYSPEGYEAEQDFGAASQMEFHEKDEDKENHGPKGSMHQSDSGTALDQCDEADKQIHEDQIDDEEDEDSSEVASQPETNEMAMDWDEKERSPEGQHFEEQQDHVAAAVEHMTGAKDDASSIPAAFEKDETPQHEGEAKTMEQPVDVHQSHSGEFSSEDGLTAEKELEDRDDTDSIDGGTPDDEKDIDESCGSSKQLSEQSAAAFGLNTSNLSPLAPPFSPSNQSFDPFGQQGNVSYMGGQAANFEGFNADAKPFEPADEWGKPMNLPSPPPPESKKPNGVTAARSSTTSTMKSRTTHSKLDSKTTDKKLADNKKTETKKPTTLGKSKPLTERKTAASSKPEKRLANGDADLKSKPKTSATSLDKRSSSATAERKPLTKSRPLSSTAVKDIKTTTSVSKTESKTKLSTTKRPTSTTSGSRTSPASKPAPPLPPHTTFYVDLTYIPNHGDPTSSDIEFFKRIRARYYVLSALSPNPQILNALLEAKQTWEDKELEVTVIPTYDNETLRHWMGLHRDQLTDLKIDVAPSASRCTIQLQDHETSCSAYRLEF